MTKHDNDCNCIACLMRYTIEELREEVGQLQCAVNLFRSSLEDEKKKHAETRERLKKAVGLK